MLGNRFQAECVDRLLLMFRPVSAARDTFQIGQIIVKRVVIHVVDMVARRNRAVSVFPNFLMQSLDTLRAMSPAWRKVDPIRSARTVGIAPEGDAFINDGLHSRLGLCSF